MVSIHTPHAERDVNMMAERVFTIVSIHTPHAERDYNLSVFIKVSISFNPHAPCGARQNEREVMESLGMFQSTRPMRSATPIK